MQSEALVEGALAVVVTASRPFPAGAPARPEEADGLLSKVARTGDRDAFSRLFLFFAPRVKAYLMRIGCSAEQAEDLAQDALMKVWRKARLFDSEKASAATWIFTIARNLRIDALRRLSRQDADPKDPSFQPEEEPRADDACERKARDAKIRAAFESLPPNQHAVVTLHFFEDEPHSAIARRLNLPLGTVKSRLRLAFEKIRRELGDQP
jgi:RNA polymerase sigma-70 factor (ECF subfamily)